MGDRISITAGRLKGHGGTVVAVNRALYGDRISCIAFSDDETDRLGRRINLPDVAARSQLMGRLARKRPWANLEGTMIWLSWRETERNTKPGIVRPLRLRS